MSEVTTNNGLFKPKLSRSESKADITDRMAWQILDSEAETRETKTARLRAARLAHQETVIPAEMPKKRRPSPAHSVRRGKSSR